MKVELKEVREVLYEKSNLNNLLKHFILDNLNECEEKRKSITRHTIYFVKDEKIVFIHDTDYGDFFVNLDDFKYEINLKDYINQKIILETINKFSFLGIHCSLYRMNTHNLPPIDSLDL